jgi:DNA relaxase NicK
VYLLNVGRCTETGRKVHTQYLCLYQLEKSLVVEDSTELDYRIRFRDTKILAKTSGYMD